MIMVFLSHSIIMWSRYFSYVWPDINFHANAQDEKDRRSFAISLSRSHRRLDCHSKMCAFQ